MSLTKTATLDLLSNQPGVFEAHLTTEYTSDASSFAAFCAARDWKFVSIELPRGVMQQQPMTATYHQGVFAKVLGEVRAMGAELASAGFPVVRTKVEAVSAAHMPADPSAMGYFEYHLKLRLPNADATLAAMELAVAHGAHLSRNARRTLTDGSHERFVTLRVHHAGRREADARFRALEADLRALGVPLSHRLREFVVYDSNASVDDGWLP
ncbi:MAG: hypothetical protein AAGE52_27375 [Myxococcota bacterium]